MEIKLDEIRDYVVKYYKPSNCALTPLSSQGNEDDVFYDGLEYGTSMTLYHIGKLLGIDLPKPEEPDFN